MLQVGETVESFGGVEPVPLRLLDVSLETLDTFTGQVADPQEIMEFCRFASGRPRSPTAMGTAGAVFGRVRVPAGRHRHSRRGSGRPRRATGRDGTGAVGPGILAAVTPTGTLLSVEANGTRRFDEVVASLRASDRRTRQAGLGVTATESPFIDPSDPVVAEALAEFTAGGTDATPIGRRPQPCARISSGPLVLFAGFAQGQGTISPTRLRRALRL